MSHTPSPDDRLLRERVDVLIEHTHALIEASYRVLGIARTLISQPQPQRFEGEGAP